MRNRRRAVGFSGQGGMSALGLIATVAGVVAFVVLTLRLGPHYIDFRTLEAVMEGLPGSQVHEMDKRAILETLQKRFKINNLRSFKVRDVVTIDRNKSGTTIVVNYEIREPLLFNADIVLSFNESYSYR